LSLASGTSFGPYEIIEPLGKGGMASVYKAYEAALDRHVALKVLPGEFLHDQDFSERFNREARLIAKLEHPNIIPIYNFGIDQASHTPWISLRLISGGALSSSIKQRRLGLDRVVDIIQGAASALDYAHSRGVVHRDVKPQNILLDEAGRVYLADFGIAKMFEGTSALTQAGMITGTPQYMAPEQATGQQLDNRADIYALGVVAYEMLTGRVPFTADTPIAVLMKHVQDPLPLPSPDDVPGGMALALVKALAKAPGDRWPTATEFADALRKGMQEALYVAPDLRPEQPTAPSLQAVTARPAMAPTMPPQPMTRPAPPVVPPPPPRAGFVGHPPVAEPPKSKVWIFVGLAVGILILGVGALGVMLLIGAIGSTTTTTTRASPSPFGLPPATTLAATTTVTSLPTPASTEAPVAIDDPQVTPTPPPPPTTVPPVRITPPPRTLPAVTLATPPPVTATATLRLDIDAQQSVHDQPTDVLFLQLMVDGRQVRSMTVVFTGKDAFTRSRKRETFEVMGIPVGTRTVSLVASPDRTMARDVIRGTTEILIEEGLNRAYAQVRFMGDTDREIRLR
jgi:serine/threonine protein kinase